MKYAMCPECGRRLCKGEPGTKVEVECPKCGKTAVVVIDVDNLHETNNRSPYRKGRQVVCRN